MGNAKKTVATILILLALFAQIGFCTVDLPNALPEGNATFGLDGNGTPIYANDTGMPPSDLENGSTANNTTSRILLTVNFTSLDGKALPNESVVFSHDGNETEVYTDAAGMASLELENGSQVNATISKNEYNYTFSFYVEANESPKSESASLYPLLKIKYFKSKPADTENCYLLEAMVTDLRANRPITARLLQLRNGSKMEKDVQIEFEPDNVISGKICAVAKTYARMVITNKYETAESVILLSYRPPTGDQPPPWNSTALPPPASPPSQTEGYFWVVIAVIGLAVILIAAVKMRGKSESIDFGDLMGGVVKTGEMVVDFTVRPIIEYLRSIRRKDPKKQGKT